MATTTLRPPTRRRPMTAAPARRVRHHVPYTHPDIPGVCNTCHLPILVNAYGKYLNDRHMTLDEFLAQLVTADADVMAAAAGERPYG